MGSGQTIFLQKSHNIQYKLWYIAALLQQTHLEQTHLEAPKYTPGFHNFNLRTFNLRVSNPNEVIVDVFLTRCRISMCQGLGPKKHDEISEIDGIMSQDDSRSSTRS